MKLVVSVGKSVGKSVDKIMASSTLAEAQPGSSRFDQVALAGSRLAAPWDSADHNRSHAYELREVPPFPCERWRSRMTMQQLLQFTKGSDAGCKTWGRARCYLQIPKTGSSTVKTMFSLPIVGTIRPKGICSTKVGVAQPCAGTVPHCAQTLVTWREPFARFISGIGTIHRRTWRWCKNSTRFESDVALCRRLETPLDFARYASGILDEVEGIISKCTPYREAGPQNLTPELCVRWPSFERLQHPPRLLPTDIRRFQLPSLSFHVLPQWIFLRLLPTPSAADMRHVAAVQPTCVRNPLRIVNNTGEGTRTAVRVGADELRALGRVGTRLLSRVAALYRPDLNVWELLSKTEHGSALNLIV
jgi:hypothetical protein